MKLASNCLAVCEEFTDDILIDSKRNSIILNIDEQWYEVLNNRLTKMGCSLIHKTTLGWTFTCVYVIS
jgi:hypothetical protein